MTNTIRIASVIACGLLVLIVSGPADAAEDLSRYWQAGAYGADGILEGRLKPAGCRFSDPERFYAQIVNGRVKGRLLYSALNRGNPNAYEKQKTKGEEFAFFDFEIRADGKWGSHSHRDAFFVRQHSSGADKLQWVRGRITEDKHVIVQVHYGVIGVPASHCGSEGVFFRRAELTAEQKLQAKIDNQLEHFNNELFLFKSEGRCAGRHAKDAIRVLQFFKSKVREHRDSDPETAKIYARAGTERHLQVAELAVEMKCKELALDQFDDTLRAEKGYGFDELRASAEQGIQTVEGE